MIRWIKLFNEINPFNHFDMRAVEMEKDLEFLQLVVVMLALVTVILIVVVFLQMLKQNKLREAAAGTGDEKPEKKPAKKGKARAKDQTPLPVGVKIAPKELPDPGLIFKFSLANEKTKEKLITVGQIEGNIKTYSTEIMDDHLSIFIRILDNQRERDIYDLPDKIVEEYMLDLRRDGKALIYHQGMENYKEMESRKRIYLKQEAEETEDVTFQSLDAKSPIRIRLGDRLNQDGKFVSGYFEFHLFTQDYTVQTKAGIPKIEKNFLVRLYKIYPGYDTGSPTEEGLYPMVDPYTTG
ncbi:MAG: hypothetical protein GY754_18330 [bacterium]|nr:hypothetical protein [bacterium]